MKPTMAAGKCCSGQEVEGLPLSLLGFVVLAGRWSPGSLSSRWVISGFAPFLHHFPGIP